LFTDSYSIRLKNLAYRLACAFIALCATFLTTIIAHAAVFTMPPPGSNMVGALQAIIIANPNVTLLDIARRFDLGHHEITAANPTVSVWTPKVGDRVVIPTQFILPPRPHKGVVINIPQRRLFYFIDKSDDKPAEVITFPLSVSRPGWKTPLGKTRIVAKHCNPAWIVPKSIREERLRDGEPDFPTYFPPGPDNPMGMLALQTGFSSIFIHGTNEPWGIGMRTSHGCLHLYPEDAAYLFPRVRPGTPVRIIDQPHTIGVHDGALYMSSSESVSEYSKKRSPARAVDALLPYIGKQSGDAPAHGEIDWRRAFTVAAEQRYLPIPISRSAPALEQIIESIDAKPYTEEPYNSSANNAALPMGELQDVASLCELSK
jgi:L,D-transpeptidase ErfK/SrfK